MIEQHGDDPAVGKKAADMVKAIGSPEQVEEAYAALASHFPADASVWLRLGDARFAAEKDVPALDAYRRAAKADPGNADARAGGGSRRRDSSPGSDPARLAVRERARRWDEILQRVLDRGRCLRTVSGDREGKAAPEEAGGQSRSVRVTLRLSPGKAGGFRMLAAQSGLAGSLTRPRRMREPLKAAMRGR